jgi:PAS domain S-box-containing protein
MTGPLDHLNFELCEAAPDAIVIARTDGVIAYVNGVAETMFGHARADLVGGLVEMLMAPDVREAHVLHRATYARNPRTRPMGAGLRLEGQRADGIVFPVEISLSPIRAASDHVMAVIRDVTERERAEDELRETQADLATVNERDRIARDLHDTVIQQLFAVGMTLQSLVGTIEDGAQVERLEWAVDELDSTIREVRSVIFGLQSPRGDGGLRSRIMFLAREAQRTLGFEPTVRLVGLVDTAVSDAVAEQVVLAAREALANVVRHAEATGASVRVAVAGDRVRLVVSDDGKGIAPGAPAGHGLRNLTERADALGGSCTVQSEPGRGTSVEWEVPVA